MARLVVVVLLALTARADAFCGFFIDSGGAEMFNDATQVVLMRDGTRTVLAMENTYAGPLADFAVVIPVPTVLHQSDVRTLPKSLFDKVNAMTAPRLVEYWEDDPCYPEQSHVDERDFAKHSGAPFEPSVKIEAQFDVDEYKIVILSASDSAGLARYLTATHYKIPEGAAPLLRPYVEAGSKFFVAKVDPTKVHFEKGKALLSPLRFFYDTDDFTLPIRLGLANSAGTQDLVVNVIADKQRYDVANYPNTTIPTNLDVVEDVRTRFPEFYAGIFDRTLQEHPGAIVTEYSWSAQSCDPCPIPPLDDADFKLLGEEVLKPLPPPPPPPPPAPDVPLGPDEVEMGGSYVEEPPHRDFVITRLHARYGKDGAAADLVFRKAPPITGGRESSRHGKLPHDAQPADWNQFQARYVIRHPWPDPIDCEAPKRGIWTKRGRDRRSALGAATDQTAVPRGRIALQDLVADDVPELAIVRGVPLSPPLPMPVKLAPRAQGCGCRTTDSPASLLVLAALLRRRRRDRVGSARAASRILVHDRIGDRPHRVPYEARLREGK